MELKIVEPAHVAFPRGEKTTSVEDIGKKEKGRVT